ncbi:hypothetical protein [Actinoplanes sp. NPDC026619]|uniref:hypothetical protein n=1 Tax=Actinoplanes sp. NPDC026619 TaxID=3155798 RepID=UPI0033FDC617
MPWSAAPSFYEQSSPAWFWTEQERAEHALFKATTVTHPRCAEQRLGCHFAWWVLDYAARTGRTWAPLGTTEPGLVSYHREVQGWDVVRVMDRVDVNRTGMA